MLNDEIVDEVRAIREAHATKFNYDLRAIYEDLKKSEVEHIPLDIHTSLLLLFLPRLTRHFSGLASLAAEFAR